jgi:hypothetical protein
MKKPAKKAKPAAKTVPKSRAAKPVPAEHRIAVTGVAVAVTYGRNRTEQFELRGTATLNAGSPEGTVRTTGLVVLSSAKGSKNGLQYNPASLSRNLVLTVVVSEADLALFREIFVTGTGSEMSDPALVIWASTARQIRTDASDATPITEFGYRLDFDPAPMGPR